MFFQRGSSSSSLREATLPIWTSAILSEGLWRWDTQSGSTNSIMVVCLSSTLRRLDINRPLCFTWGCQWPAENVLLQTRFSFITAKESLVTDMKPFNLYAKQTEWWTTVGHGSCSIIDFQINHAGRFWTSCTVAVSSYPDCIWIHFDRIAFTLGIYMRLQCPHWDPIKIRSHICADKLKKKINSCMQI